MREEIKQRIEQIRRGEVPDGYKKTKGKILPSAWASFSLGDIYAERKEVGIPSLPILTVSIHSGVSDGALDEDELGKKVKRIEDKTQYRTARSGDVVFNMMRAWQGAIGVVRQDGLVSPAYIVATPNEVVYPPFMDYCLKTPQMINRLHRKSYGVTDFRLRLYWDSFAKVDCVLPPLAEQQKIAEILSMQDKLIALKEKLIEEKKRQKKALMQQLLTGKKRLPGFSGEWSSVLFKECITEVDDRSTESNQHPILSVTKDGIVYQADHFNKQIASDNNIGYKIIKRNQLAFSILNLWMGSVDVLTLCDVGIVSPAYKVFECVEKNLIPSFAKYFLRSYNVIWLYNINSETGASVVRKNLDLAALLNEKLEIPPIDEQGAIAKVLSTADAEIELLQKDLDQEKQKKKALMQLLLTGIVRVKENE